MANEPGWAERRPASQFKVWSKNCRTREIRAADMAEVFGERIITRYNVLAHVNKWNELSAHDEDCLWLYWLED